MALVGPLRVALAALLLLATACKSSSWDPVEGSEDGALAQGLTGTLLVRESPRAESEILVHALSGGEARKLTLELEADTFSGPDADGRIVYDCVHHPNLAADARSTHEIRLAWLDGRPETVLMSESGILQGRNALALSSRGGDVACAVGDRGHLVLSLLHLEDGAQRTFPLKAKHVDDLQWLEDGRRLVFAGTFAWEDAPFALRPSDPPARFGRRADMDLVCIVDLERRTETPLCPGTRALAVVGQNALAIADANGVSVVDATNGKRLRELRPIPGSLPDGPHVIAAFDLDRVLYVGRPTRGSKMRYYLGDQLLRYPMETIKVADLSRGSFATVVPYVKPPLAVYGR